MTTKAAILLIILSFTSCKRMEDKTWKYSGGFHIGDWLDFDSDSFSIKNDTIYKHATPLAKVYSQSNRLVDQTLVIEKLNDTIKGYYISK